MRRRQIATTALLCATALASFVPTSRAEDATPDVLVLSADPGAATTLDPGFYTGGVPAGDARYAKVERSPSETLVVSLALAPSVAVPVAVTLELQLPDGTSCVRATTSATDVDPSSKVQSAVVAIEPVPTARNAAQPAPGCVTATQLILGVQAPTGPLLDATLRVTTEPRIAGRPDPAAAGVGQLPPLAPTLNTTGRPVTGAPSYAAATSLDAGSYALAMQPRTLAVFRVRVAWGQQVGASLEAPRAGTDFAPPEDTEVGLTLWNPQLVPINPDTVATSPVAATLPANQTAPLRLATGSPTIEYANRDEPGPAPDSAVSKPALNWASVPGWYYLTVWSGGTSVIPTRLNVVVTGVASAGPTYADSTGTPVPQTQPKAATPGQVSSATPRTDPPGRPWRQLGLSAGVLALGVVAGGWSLLRWRHGR